MNLNIICLVANKADILKVPVDGATAESIADDESVTGSTLELIRRGSNSGYDSGKFVQCITNDKRSKGQTMKGLLLILIRKEFYYGFLLQLYPHSNRVNSHRDIYYTKL